MTPLQEFIEVLKIHRDTAFEKEGINRSKKPFLPANSTAHYNTEYYEGRAKAFEDAISFAEAHLEKEKGVMCEFAIKYAMADRKEPCETSTQLVFDETFKINSK